MEDLKPGMKLPGIVTNVTAFGAFVDIGVHQDGLVHVSQLADRFMKDPAEVVKVQQKVMVTVMEVDLPRKRIALSMKAKPELGPAAGAKSSPAFQRNLRPRSPAEPAPAKPADWFTEALNKGQGLTHIVLAGCVWRYLRPFEVYAEGAPEKFQAWKSGQPG